MKCHPSLRKGYSLPSLQLYGCSVRRRGASTTARGPGKSPTKVYERLTQARGDPTARLGRQNSKLCTPNDRIEPEGFRQKGLGAFGDVAPIHADRAGNCAVEAADPGDRGEEIVAVDLRELQCSDLDYQHRGPRPHLVQIAPRTRGEAGRPANRANARRQSCGAIRTS
jgi:hypothetical protein